MKVKQITLMLLLAASIGCQQKGVDSPSGIALPLSQEELLERARQEPTRFVKVEPGEVTRTTYEASFIDTTKFETQVWRTEPYNGEIRDVEGLRGGDAELPDIRKDGTNDLIVDGHVSEFERVHPQTSFPGIDQSFFTPPDPTVAVGPNHVVEMVNSEIAFFTKDGQVTFQAPLGNQGTPGFFEDVGAEDFCVDPRCFYDHYENRFVVLCLEVYFSPPDSFLTIAVSDDDDPNGVWFKYRMDGVYQSGGQNNFADYPTFGYDEQGYYIGGNLFSITNFSLNGASIRTMDKTPLLNGDPAVVNDLIDTSGLFTIQMAKSFGATGAPIGVAFNNSDSATVVAIEDPFNNPTITTANVPVPMFGLDGNANNAGGSIFVLGGRAMNAHVRDGKLYTCHTIAEGSRDLARWYEIDLENWPNSGSPSLIQSGNIDLGPGQETYFPAIFSSKNGGIAVVYANSSNTQRVSVKASGRNVNDPPGTMSVSEEFDISSVTANGRYGDYFDIAIDPSDDSTFWIVGETQEGFGWDTTVNSFIIPALGDVNCDGAVNLLDVQPFVDLITSGEFSDKADMNGDGVVNLLDVGLFVEALTGS